MKAFLSSIPKAVSDCRAIGTSTPGKWANGKMGKRRNAKMGITHTLL